MGGAGSSVSIDEGELSLRGVLRRSHFRFSSSWDGSLLIWICCQQQNAQHDDYNYDDNCTENNEHSNERANKRTRRPLLVP